MINNKMSKTSSASNTSYSTDLKEIIDDIKRLGYVLDNWDIDFVKSLLTTPCLSRKDIFCWILKILGFDYSAHEIRTFDNSVITRIINDLQTIGLFRGNDLKLIDGTANYKSQLKFWRALIDVALRIKESSNRSQCSDSFLFHLVSSPFYEDSLKENDMYLIPEDLKPLCKKFTEKICLKEEMQNLEQECKCLQEKNYKFKDKTPEEEDESAAKLFKQMELLEIEKVAFLEVYETALKPWCKNLPEAPETPSKIGELASECHKKYNNYYEYITLMKNMDSNSAKINGQLEKLEHKKKHDTTSKLLQSIIE